MGSRGLVDSSRGAARTDAGLEKREPPGPEPRRLQLAVAPLKSRPTSGSSRTHSPRVIALVPAHDEAGTIGRTLAALEAQTRPPDAVVVVADNCTDETATMAKAAGVAVVETVDNRHKKAGALNQVLTELLPHLEDNDVILIQDADSFLDPDFVEGVLQAFAARRALGGVGGTFRGQRPDGPTSASERFLAHLQDNEFARYARDVRRLRGRCLVVTGTAAMFRVGTLRQVSRARLRGVLPPGDGRGGVYDTSVLTEDNELSFAVQTLGLRLFAPATMTLVTEVMPTWRALWRQRLRWKRGALENCAQYGVTAVTWRYWGRQVLTGAGVLVTTLYLLTVVLALVTGRFGVHPFWAALTGVFCLERFVTLKDKGWRHQLTATFMYELPYELFLQAAHAKAYADAFLRRERKW